MCRTKWSRHTSRKRTARKNWSTISTSWTVWSISSRSNKKYKMSKISKISIYIISTEINKSWLKKLSISNTNSPKLSNSLIISPNNQLVPNPNNKLVPNLNNNQIPASSNIWIVNSSVSSQNQSINRQTRCIRYRQTIS